MLKVSPMVRSFKAPGMTGFDSVIPTLTVLLFGMAMVPVTHLLHSILADSKILAAARNILDQFKMPAPAVA